MKKIIITGFLILTSTPVFADGIWLLNKQECNETTVGVGTALGMADYLFKEVEKNNNLQQAEEKRKLKEEELLRGAIAFSQIAANYSIVYDVWCKDMINNRMHASLTDDEKEYLDKVLSELKMNYVEVEKTEDAKPVEVEAATSSEDSDDSSSEE